MSYADRMAAMAVTVRSPDGLITGEMTGGVNVTVRFAAGAYRRYREEALERQLAALLRLIMAGRQRVRLAALAEAAGEPVSGEEDAADEPTSRFLQVRARMYVEGVSPGNVIRISATGLREWDVAVAGGTVGSLDERQFLAELRGAMVDFLGAHARGMARLKAECFGTDFERLVGSLVARAAVTR